MANIYEVSKTINAIAAGLEEECLNCMDANKSIIRDCIQEQLYSGMDGTDRCLSPTYDNDPISMSRVPGRISLKSTSDGKKKSHLR